MKLMSIINQSTFTVKKSNCFTTKIRFHGSLNYSNDNDNSNDNKSNHIDIK